MTKVTNFLLKLLKILLGWTTKIEKTRKKNQKDKENLYMGPEFLIELRYAQVLFFCVKGFFKKIP